MIDSSDIEEDRDEQAEIEAIYRRDLSESTREAYNSRIKHFVAYLRRTDPDLVIDDDSFHADRIDIRQIELFLIYKQDEARVTTTALEVFLSLPPFFELLCSYVFLELQSCVYIRLSCCQCRVPH